MKEFKLLFAISILTLVSIDAFAQQVPVYTQSRENDNLVNPAAVTRAFIVTQSPTTIGATYRAQWIELEGAPTTQSVRFSHYLEDKSLDLGGHILNDKTGLFSNTGVYLRGAYHLDLGGYKTSKLSVGMSAGVVQYRVGRDANLFDESEDFTDKSAKIVPDIGIGAYFYNETFHFGLSIPQTFGLSQTYDNLVEGQEYEISRVQHIYASAGAYLLIDEYSNSYLEPHLQVKYVAGAPVNIDLSSRYRYKEIFFVGLGYQTSNTGHFEAGLMLNEDNVGIDGYLQIGYGYGTNFTDYGPSFGGSHEVNLLYTFGY